MDTRTNMIIAKGKFVTSDVVNCIYDSCGHQWELTFASGKTFHYNTQNVVWLTNSVSINPKNVLVRQNENLLNNLTVKSSSVRSKLSKA